MPVFFWSEQPPPHGQSISAFLSFEGISSRDERGWGGGEADLSTGYLIPYPNIKFYVGNLGV